MVGLGINGSRGFSVRSSSPVPLPPSYPMLTIVFFIRLGPTALAAQSILLVSASTTYQAPFALGMATSVRLVVFFFFFFPHSDVRNNLLIFFKTCCLHFFFFSFYD